MELVMSLGYAYGIYAVLTSPLVVMKVMFCKKKKHRDQIIQMIMDAQKRFMRFSGFHK